MIPYITDQIKRFGEYSLDLASCPANLTMPRDKFLFKARNDELDSVADFHDDMDENNFYKKSI